MNKSPSESNGGISHFVTHSLDSYADTLPDLIFLNRLGMLSSSKGNVPHSKAYRITPIDHTSTSAPAYRLPLITCMGEYVLGMEGGCVRVCVRRGCEGRREGMCV